MAVKVIYTDEIGLAEYTFTPELLSALTVTQGISLAVGTASFTLLTNQSLSKSRRNRVRVQETLEGTTYTLFDGFVTEVAWDYDPKRVVVNAATVTPISEQFLLTEVIQGTLASWNFRGRAPYEATIDAIQDKTFRGTIREIQDRLVEPELTFADVVDILYTEYGLVLHGTTIFPIWGSNNTVALTGEDILPGRRYREKNVGNSPGDLANIQFRSPFLRVDINQPLLSLAQEEIPIPEDRKWFVKDNRTQTNQGGSEYQVAVDKWILAREAAEIQATTPLRFDIQARTKVTFPAGFWEYDTPWIVEEVTYDWKAHTTAFKAHILEGNLPSDVV